MSGASGGKREAPAFFLALVITRLLRPFRRSSRSHQDPAGRIPRMPASGFHKNRKRWYGVPMLENRKARIPKAGIVSLTEAARDERGTAFAVASLSALHL